MTTGGTIIRTILIALLLLAVLPQRDRQPAPVYPPDQRNQGRIDANRFQALTGRLPLAIEKTPDSDDYHGRGQGYAVSIGPAGIRLAANGREAAISFKGASSSAQPETSAPLPGRTNYFIGDDPEQWRRDVRGYDRVTYRKIYHGIDVEYYGTQEAFEYDFIVAPQVDPGKIRMQISGDEPPVLASNGDLILTGGAEGMRIRKPVIYQELDGRRIEIEGGFDIVKDREVGFIIGQYDRRLPLIIDPIIEYASYYGGGGTDIGYGIAVDRLGNIYVTGQTASLNFPQKNGFYQMLQGANDAFVMKLSSLGSTVIFATYIGGRNPGDKGWSIAVDASNNIYFTGETNSLNYPTVNAVQPLFRGNVDAFLTKLNSEGNAILFSTYMGGSLPDASYGLVLDKAGNCYITGRTDSDNFPVLEPIQGTLRGQRDIFISKFDADGALLFSTYFGGDGESPSNRDDESAYGIAIDQFDRIYVTGYTSSPSFPIVDGLQFVFGGVEDAFVTKMDIAKRTVIYSSYIGGTRADNARGIAVDDFGNAYIIGFTLSTDFPVLNPIQENYAGNIDGFIAKIDASGRNLIYSTYLGGSSDENTGVIVENVPSCAIAVDRAGNAYLTGKTASADFPLALPIQANMRGDNDLYIARIDPGGSHLVYSTFFGSSFTGSTGFEERGIGIAINSLGAVYVTGQVLKNDMVTILPVQGIYGGGLSDAMIMRISTPDIFIVTPVSAASFSGGGLAPDSIATVFGLDLAEGVEVATELPLPTTLMGTRVRIIDSTGNEADVPLFFVSPSQINILIPGGTPVGRARLVITNARNMSQEVVIWINDVAPGIFTANASGQGLPSAILLRLKADGAQIYEPVVFYDQFGNVSPAPIRFGDATDQLFLILFATGVRQVAPSNVRVSIGGIDIPVLYAGQQGGFAGLDQINLSLPRELEGKGTVPLRLEADHWMANQVSLVFE